MVGLAIIDSHQHFWDLGQNYLPWLCDEPPIPFRYGDYSALRRDYMPADYRVDTRGFRVEGTVFVETEWDRSNPVGETRWIHAVAAESGLPSVVVCHVALDSADAVDTLAEQAGYPLVRGVRHKPRVTKAPQAVVAAAAGSMSDPAWRRGYAALSRHGFSFDLQAPWWHLDEALALNRDFPETRLILNHTGLPGDRSPADLEAWAGAMTRLSTAPNVAVKISGLGEPGRRWSLDRNREIILRTVDTFGIDRCMFGSNFPVDSLVGSFHTIFSGFIEATVDLGPEAQSHLFSRNAQRIYGINRKAGS